MELDRQVLGEVLCDEGNAASTIVVEADTSITVCPEFVIIEPSEFTDGKKRAMCKLCQLYTFTLDSKDRTTKYMKKHLEICKPFQAGMASQGIITESRFDQRVYRGLVAKAIIKHGYGFSWVEHQGDRDVHSYLNTQVNAIPRNIAESDCVRLHSFSKQQLKNTLLSLPGRICLTCDVWTSCQAQEYLCLTAHFVDSDWKLNSKVLNFRYVEPPHTWRSVWGTLLDLFKEWDIKHKLFSITLGNAPRNDEVRQDLKSWLVKEGLLLCSGNYFYVECVAPTLDLIASDCLKAFDGCVAKVRESVRFVDGSMTRTFFQKCVKCAKIKETKPLWLDVPTRWTSTYLMLERALLYHCAFSKLGVYAGFFSCPTDDEWEKIESVHEFLTPFFDLSSMLTGSEYPTANLYFEKLWVIDMFIKDQLQSRDTVMKDMAERMRAKFDKYWSDHNIMFAFAVILDPRCKLGFLKFCYEKLYEDQERVYFKFYEVRMRLEMLLKKYSSKCTSSPKLSSSLSSSTIQQSLGHPSRKRKLDYLAELDEIEADESENTMLDVYLADPRMERGKEFDVLAFWKSNQERYGELSLLARDVLSVPPTAFASESTFSIGGRILNKWKNSYIPKNVEALITTQSWLYGFESSGQEEFTGSYVDWTESCVY